MTEYSDEKNPWPNCETCPQSISEECLVSMCGFPCPRVVYKEGYEQALKDVEKDKKTLCHKCGKPVEQGRRCYVIPMCYNCLPPPPPIPIIEHPKKESR
jgi:hypothetical protein